MGENSNSALVHSHHIMTLSLTTLHLGYRRSIHLDFGFAFMAIPECMAIAIAVCAAMQRLGLTTGVCIGLLC